MVRNDGGSTSMMTGNLLTSAPTARRRVDACHPIPASSPHRPQGCALAASALMDSEARDQDRSRSAAEFAAFAATARQELQPEGLLEGILADRIILAAWSLRDTIASGASHLFDSEGDGTIELRAERTLLRALAAFERLRDRRGSQWGRPAPSDSKAMLPGTEDEEPEELPGPVEGRGWPLSEDEEIEEPAPEPERDENDPSHLWVGRLVCDPSVSADSPVVRGTWITVRHVVSLVIDGWTWADILRAHPELTEDDIRACLTYATEEENASLPL